MTDIATAKPTTFTGSETKLLTKLLASKEPIAKTDLMAGVTESEGSFKVLLSKLRTKGMTLKPTARGQAVAAAYVLTDDERSFLKRAGF